MKLFEDNYLTKQIKSLHLGKVPIGSSQTSKFYIKNTEGGCLESLKFIIKPYLLIESCRYYGDPTDSPEIRETIELLKKEISIVNAPKTMNPYSTAVLEIKWSPINNFKRGISCDIDITADLVYEG